MNDEQPFTPMCEQCSKPIEAADEFYDMRQYRPVGNGGSLIFRHVHVPYHRACLPTFLGSHAALADQLWEQFRERTA